MEKGYVILDHTFCLFFFFKQKTAYEIKECDWSSDVCSSDLKSAEQESAAGGSNCATPIAVHPIARDSEFQPNDDSAEQRPARRQPCQQHPIDCRAHCRTAQQHSYPRLTEQFADGKNKSLPGRIHRCVTRMPVHMESFETDPHRMRRIRKPAMRERISHEQITEFVVDARYGNGQARKQSCSNCDGE